MSKEIDLLETLEEYPGVSSVIVYLKEEKERKVLNLKVNVEKRLLNKLHKEYCYKNVIVQQKNIDKLFKKS